MTSMNDVATRLQAMEDRIAISELRSMYCWYTARAMKEDVVELFADDAIFENTRGSQASPVRIVGRAALADFFTKMRPGRRIPLVVNEVIQVDGDEAQGTCAMVSFGEDNFVGHYVDKFRRVGGRWLFSHRQFFPYWPDFRPDSQRLHP